jgi:hypothetical protein
LVRFFGIATYLLLKVSSIADGQSNLLNQDYTYKNSIKTILLYPHYQGDIDPKHHLKAAVGVLNSDQNLVLEFDDLSDQFQTYHVKILPYSSDWQLLRLNEVEYIAEYNDFIIADYQLSFSTKIPYYHYRFELPKLKVAGNFLLYVYKDNNKNDLVLSKRFMINANRVGVAGTVQYSNELVKRNTHQQVNFEVKYAGYSILNPKSEVKIVIRQNYRWDKTIANLKPQFDKAGEYILDYSFYQSETDFEGGNEFRFFDTRSLRSRLIGVNKIDYLEEGYNVNLYVDRLQSKKSYVFANDFDGQFLIDNYETNKGDTEADYCHVKFNLEANNTDETEYYVVGSFNNFKCDENNKMVLDTKTNLLSAQIYLKQGIYNYNYVTKNPVTSTPEQTFTEGNHSQTQNTYEIFVYHKPFGGRTEQLVGYKILDFNQRR